MKSYKTPISVEGKIQISTGENKAVNSWENADVSAEVHAEQLLALFRNVTPAVLAAAAGAGLLAALLIHLGFVTRQRGVAWALYIAAGAAAHLALREVYRRAQPPRQKLEQLGLIFTAICAAEGLGWGWASIALVNGNHFDSKMLIAAITIAISAGSVPTFSPYLPSLAAFFLSATVPYTLVSVWADNPMQQATALMMLLYIGAVGALGVIASRNFKELVALRIRTNNLAQSLRFQKEVAERANVAKSSFLAAASHDLRQPVHAVGLFVGALRNLPIPAEAVRLVEQIEASTAAMDNLFSAILDISRLDAGVVDVQKQAFFIQPLLDRICRDHAEEADAKGVELVCVPCGAVVKADPVLTERILRNLVSNAVRYTDHGGVVVGCRRGAALRVEVWDTGPGIPPHQQNRIFEEYFQLGNPERDRARGLGLGLAIVRRLVDLLGYELLLKSQPGRGSCFSVAMPRVREDLMAPSEVPAGPDELVRRGLIVVVDDEVAIRDAMVALLTGWGHTVTAAGSGQEILTWMTGAPERPDLIICDYRLRADETGIEVIEALRAEYNATIPAMLITGDTAPDRLAEANASGLLLLHKPVPNGKLRAAIANLMLRPQQDAEGGG